MKTRKWFGVSVVLLLLPATTWAQATSNDVTFKVPVRITNLSPNIEALYVVCGITSLALDRSRDSSPPARFFMSTGRIDRTLDVIVRIPNPINISRSNVATYACVLTGLNRATPPVRSEFSENHALPEFRLSPTPRPITGSFEWRPVTVAPSLGTTTSP
jgi:hypothetical protein